MRHIKQRYFETRDGRCLPFQQIGQEGDFCIVLNERLDFGGLDQECRYFVPNLTDTNTVHSSSDSWRVDKPSPELFQNESETERQAKDVLDLARIFRMENFLIIGNCEVAKWLVTNYPERVQAVGSCEGQSDVALFS